MEHVLAILLAGGAGERLYPLTRDTAKPAVPFGGAYRLIDFTLSNCINSDVRRIFILTQYKSLELIRHIRDGWNILSPELGEYIDDVRSVAVPIRDYTRAVVGGLAVSGPAYRMSQDRLEKEVVSLMLKAGRELSSRLGSDGEQ